ncbi:hypothetical protein G7Y89_g9770 [Cudoniella acicularis]|uniref:Heterokaryon incompatibility domain-containing protein n=1 Tax=Cudoniella acicularis TaxID=354080 RepID=A0A8H4RE16_9HELO|nr:hypothetical protein G7Y89_g9770 [Cudoniella acicularis]
MAPVFRYKQHHKFQQEILPIISIDTDDSREMAILPILERQGYIVDRIAPMHHDFYGQTHETYSAPGSLLGEDYINSGDVWSLGCVYLDFITWLLMGYESVEQFSNSRSLPRNGTLIDDFFEIIPDLNIGDPVPKVKDSINQWVLGLHQHKNCSRFIHNVLILLMNDTLVVDPMEITSAGHLHEKLKLFLQAAERDNKYLIEPMPWDQAMESSGQYSDLKQDTPRSQLLSGSYERTSPAGTLQGLSARSISGREIVPPAIRDAKILCKIHLESLPSTFQDTVLITQKLGIRYLWIDSLCIIQDNNEDWARESCEMGNIFQNAWLVLAAAHSDDSLGGLLPMDER